MGWFDEQIKDRMRADNEVFEDSFIRAAGIIMGRRLPTQLFPLRTGLSAAWKYSSSERAWIPLGMNTGTERIS